MKRFILALIITLSTVTACFAEAGADPKTVFYTTGKAYIASNGSEQRLLIGNKIEPGSTVILEKNTEVILKNTDEDFCVLKTEDNELRINYNEIGKLFEKQKGKSVMEAMWAFVAKQLGEKEVDIRQYAEDFLRQKGGVYRAGCANPMMLAPGYMVKTDAAEIELSWVAVEHDTSYTVEIFQGGDFDLNAPLVYRRTVSALSLKVSTAELMQLGEGARQFNWVVYPTADRPSCARYYLHVMDAAEAKMIEDALSTHTAEVSGEAEQLLAAAAYYEEQHMLIAAKEVYATLLSNHDSQPNRDLYQLFMARNGMLE